MAVLVYGMPGLTFLNLVAILESGLGGLNLFCGRLKE